MATSAGSRPSVWRRSSASPGIARQVRRVPLGRPACSLRLSRAWGRQRHYVRVFGKVQLLWCLESTVPEPELLCVTELG